MKYLVFTLLFIVLPGITFGQSEQLKDSFPPLKKPPIQYNEKLETYLRLDNSLVSKPLSNSTIFQNTQNEGIKPIELNLPPLEVYTGPPLESNTFTRNPFANDYSFNSGAVISNRTWLTSFSKQSTYPTLGAVRNVGVNFHYMPLDWLVLSTGTYASKSNLGGHSFNDAGLSGSAKFIINDRIRLNAYGQYSANGGKNGVQGPMMGMYPQTFYGGTIEVKITEKFGIEGGVVRELNPFNGKWVNRPVISPVFYTK